MFRICFDLGPHEYMAKICQFSVNPGTFLKILSPPYLLEITIMVCEKNACLAACQFFLCEIWVSTKSLWHALKVTLLYFQPSNYAGKMAYILLCENVTNQSFNF